MSDDVERQACADCAQPLGVYGDRICYFCAERLTEERDALQQQLSDERQRHAVTQMTLDTALKNGEAAARATGKARKALEIALGERNAAHEKINKVKALLLEGV